MVAACDFTVENPGPVRDTLLSEESSFPALARGMERAVGEALNWIAYTSGAASQEISAAGSIGNFGITLAQRNGNLQPDENNTHWELAQQARWVAENGIERMRDGLDDFASNEIAAQSLLWVGYANRLLGENMCRAVIDGGEAQPGSVYFDRAEAAFAEAIQVARSAGSSELENAAMAGRASVNVFRGEWDAAVADAEQVPADFVYAMPYHTTTQEQYNRIYWANANQPYRAHSVVNTYYEDYYPDTGDARVAWGENPDIPFGDVGEVPWLFQLKHDTRTAPIRLSSGREMQLLLAESQLRDGAWQDAMTTINGLRATVPNDNSGGTGVDPWVANNATEAWTHLKREYGIEQWLEARRLGALRRWIENGTPGTTDDMSGRDLCFPISQNEIETNPNVNPSDNN